MDLISLLIVVIIFGVIFWLVQSVVPMPQPFKTAALVILALIFILYLLNGVGLIHTWHSGPLIR